MSSEVSTYVGVKLIADALTTQQLVSLNMAMQLGNDPRHVDGYHTAQALFAEMNSEGVPVAHDLVKGFFSRIVMERLNSK